MEIKSIPVPMSLSCSGTCPKYLQQAFKISYINFTKNKHSIDHLPRQHSNYEDKESGGNLNESTCSNISVPTPKFCNKSTQIQIGTKHKNPVFVGENRSSGYEYVPPRRENDRHNQSVQQTPIREKYNPDEINKSNQKVDFDISSSPTDSSALSLITNLPNNEA